MSLPLSHAGGSVDGISATLDLKFASSKSLTSSSGITPSFTRASSGTYFGSDGLLKYVPYNLLSYSEDLTNAAWTDKAGATITGDATSSPVGTLTADRVQITGAGFCLQKKAYTVTGNHVFSIWIKATSATVACIRLTNDAGTQSYTLNCNVTTEWQRFSVTGNWSSNPVNFYAGFDQRSIVGGPGTATDIFVWGAQAETGSTPGTYVPTTSAANSAPRFDHVYDGANWISKGLLVEEARTNSLIQSGDFSNAAYTKSFLTAPVSAVLSPDGSTYANALTEDTTTNIHRFYRNTTATAGKTVTASIFLKAGTARYAVVCHSDNTDFRSFCVADLQAGTITNSGVVYAATGASYIGSTISNCGNGWYRVSLTGKNLNTDSNYYTQVGISNSSTSTGFPSYLGSGQIIYAFGSQLEFDSAFPTSYIPTTTASATRSADVCQITGTDFSGFWNASEGSFAITCDRLAVGNIDNYLFRVDGASDAIYHEYYNGADGFQVYYAGAPPSLSISPSTTDQANFSYGFNTTGYVFIKNGSAAISRTTTSMGTGYIRISIGNATSNMFWNGHIARLRYFNKRLTNQQLEDLCKPEQQLKLDLNFSSSLSLTPTVGPTPSFSRASIGTYFGSDGILRTMGLNLLLYSEDFTNGTYWSGGSTARSGNTAVAPDGSLTADTITFNSGSQIYQNPQVLSSIGTVSVYVKKVDHRYFSAQIETSSTAHRAVFDLDTALVTDTTSGTSASISDAGNGWFRCSVTKTVAGTTAIWMTFQQSATATFSIGSGSKQFYMWGAQSEIGSSLNTYSKTTSASNSGPRFDYAYNGTSWVSKGLLIEEQRTNLCTHSEDITNASWSKYNSVAILANNATAPDGTLTADRLYPTLSGANLLEKVITGLTSGSTYSYSYYAKSAGFQWIRGVEIAGSASFWVDIINGVVGTKGTSVLGTFSVSIAPAGNGWFKISVTSVTNSTSQYIYTSPANANSNTASTPSGTSGVLYWGFQFEAGAFPTSYIPTTTAAVTRSADVCQITGTDFSGMWNASEGSLAFEADGLNPNSNAPSQTVYSADAGVDSTNSIYALRSGSNLGSDYLVLSYTAGVEKINFSTAAGFWPVNDLFKSAIGFRLNDTAQSSKGLAVVTDTNCTVPTGLTQLTIGRLSYTGGTGFPINGHISRLRYYAIRLPNRLLIAKST